MCMALVALIALFAAPASGATAQTATPPATLLMVSHPSEPLLNRLIAHFRKLHHKRIAQRKTSVQSSRAATFAPPHPRKHDPIATYRKQIANLRHTAALEHAQNVELRRRLAAAQVKRPHPVAGPLHQRSEAKSPQRISQAIRYPAKIATPVYGWGDI